MEMTVCAELCMYGPLNSRSVCGCFLPTETLPCKGRTGLVRRKVVKFTRPCSRVTKAGSAVGRVDCLRGAACELCELCRTGQE